MYASKHNISMIKNQILTVQAVDKPQLLIASKWEGYPSTSKNDTS